MSFGHAINGVFLTNGKHIVTPLGAYVQSGRPLPPIDLRNTPPSSYLHRDTPAQSDTFIGLAADSVYLDRGFRCSTDP